MHIEEIKSKVISTVVNALNVSVEEVVPNAHFVNDLGADSLTQVELILELETAFEAYDVHIGDEQAATLQTVESVVTFLDQEINKTV